MTTFEFLSLVGEEVFDESPERLTELVESQAPCEWDSMQSIVLISVLDRCFDMQLSADELARYKTWHSRKRT